jgi:hypothetical protein
MAAALANKRDFVGGVADPRENEYRCEGSYGDLHSGCLNPELTRRV